MTPTSRELAKRAQIQISGQKLFLQHGFSKTSMDVISKDSGVSKATIYNYYSSKEELLTDILENTIQNLLTNQLSIIDNDHSFQTLDEFHQILSKVGYQMVTTLMSEECLGLIRIIIAENKTLPELGDLLRNTIQKPAMLNNIAILKQAQKHGLIKIADPEMEITARLFFGPILTYLFVNGLLIGDDLPQIPDFEQISKIVAMYIKAITYSR